MKGQKKHFVSIAMAAIMTVAAASTVWGATPTQPEGYFGQTVQAEEKEMICDIYGRLLTSAGSAMTDEYYQVGSASHWRRTMEACCFHSVKLSRIMTQSDGNGACRLYVEYTGDMTEFRQHEAEYEASVASVVAMADGLDDEAKVRFFHDYLVENCEYDLTLSKSRAYDCLVGGSAVCNGYAIAFYNLCSAAGMEANYIVGTVTTQQGVVLHAWNRVQINGKWRYYDVTFDDTSRSNLFFGLSEEEMGRTHAQQDIV